MKTATEIFLMVYGNKTNFLTRSIDRRGSVGNRAYEVSTGRGITGNKIYGFTVINFDPKLNKATPDHEASHLCHSEEEIAEAIAGLAKN